MRSLLLGLCLMATSLLAHTENCHWLQDHITWTPGFPKQGITFLWYSPLLRDPLAFQKVTSTFAQRYQDAPIDVIAALDARGFIFGTALAHELNLPLVLIRKPGKLPGEVQHIDYQLEYGSNTFEIEKSSITPGNNVLIIDDILATGGTVEAASCLIEQLGGTVHEIACLFELSFLGAREKVQRPIYSLLAFDGE